jgi:hypothetical protein
MRRKKNARLPLHKGRVATVCANREVNLSERHRQGTCKARLDLRRCATRDVTLVPPSATALLPSTSGTDSWLRRRVAHRAAQTKLRTMPARLKWGGETPLEHTLPSALALLPSTSGTAASPGERCHRAAERRRGKGKQSSACTNKDDAREAELVGAHTGGSHAAVSDGFAAVDKRYWRPAGGEV